MATKVEQGTVCLRSYWITTLSTIFLRASDALYAVVERAHLGKVLDDQDPDDGAAFVDCLELPNHLFRRAIHTKLQQMSSGLFVACVSARRTWERFTMQAARVTSAPCATRSDAELVVQRLLDDFKGMFAQ